MDGKKLVVAALLVAVVFFIQPVHGQSSGSGVSTLPVGLGFSQGSVQPVSAGVPVYTAGDQLWFRSYGAEPVNVTVTQPQSGPVGYTAFTGGVPGNTSDSLYTFSNTDPAGLWLLTASNSSESVRVQFYLVSGGAPTAMSGYSVGGDGLLAMNYTLDSASAYDVSACSAGSQSTATVYVPVPSALGGGTLLLTLNGTAVSVIPQGNERPFTFWLALTQDYSFQLNDSVTVVSKSMEVASTQSTQVSGSLTSAFSTAFLDELPIRTGQYTLSTNFDTGQGVSVSDTSVLVTGAGPWVWLQGCSVPAEPLSTTVTVTASLLTGPSTWPRYVYMLYQELGVGLFTVAPVAVQPAEVQVTASQWGTPLTDAQVEVSGASQYAVGNGTIYLIGEQYPLEVTVATPQTPSQQVEVANPYTVAQVEIPANQVVVQTTSGGSAISGAVVTIEDSAGSLATANTTNGEAVFYVPPGNFTVQAQFGGSVESSELVTHAATGAGQSLLVTIQFAGAASGVVGDLLLALLGIGIILSGIVWATAYRRRAGGRIP